MSRINKTIFKIVGAVLLGITAFLMPAVNIIAADVLKDYYNTGEDNNAEIYSTTAYGQTFTASDSYDLTSVKLKLYREGTLGNIGCYIFATSGDLPDDDYLKYKSQSGSAITTSTSGEWVTFTFSSVLAVTNGTKYAIVLTNTTGSTSNSIHWLVDATSPTYSGGSYIVTSDSGASWGASTDYDFMFETYEIGAPDAPTNVSATDGTHTDKVVITWTKSTGATGYKVYRDGNLVDTLGDVATYDDVGAAAGSITAGTASASDGTSSTQVVLSVSGESVANGTTYAYTVKAVNAGGDSVASSADNGYRGVGSITYQWQRSAADSDAAYGNIVGATTDPYNDTAGAEYPSGRYYKCVLSATGASNATTTADRGYTAATRYWVGGTGNWSDDDNHWALTSGGAPADGNLPTQYTNVYFDANSFTGASQVVTVDVSANCKDMDWTGATNNPTLAIGTQLLNIYGNITFIAAMATTGTTGQYVISGTGNCSLTTNGLTINGRINQSSTGTTTLADNLTLGSAATHNLYLSAGTVNTNNKTIVCTGGLYCTGSSNTTFTLGSSTVTFISWNYTGSNLTLTANTSTINCSGNFSGGGLTTYNIVNLTGATSTISGSNTFAQLNLASGTTQTVTFTDGTTQTITGTLSLSGSVGHVHTLQGSGVAGWGISYTGAGTLLFNYLHVSYSTATQDNIFYANNSTNGGNNVRWYFAVPTAPTDVSATDGTDTSKVIITWTDVAGATGYKVYQDGILLDTLGDVVTYDDTTAAAGVITAGTASASDGTSETHVVLTLSGMSVADGTTHVYTVAALNPIGDGSQSLSDTGYRGAGTLEYQWQRSAADSDAAYGNIAGATTNPYNDTGGEPFPDGRYYRCYVTADGSTPAYSTVDRGYIYFYVAPTVTTEFNIGIGGTWAILRGTIVDAGSDPITEVGFEYGLTTGYGSTESSTGSWTTGDVFVLQIDSLSPATKYNYRAYATSAGDGYGANYYVVTEGAPSIYEYLDDGGDADSSDIYGANWEAQYFTAGDNSHTITAVKVYIKRTGDCGTITLSLRHAAGGLPIGTDIVSDTIDESLVSTSYNWYTFDLTEVELESGQTYAIVLRAVSGDDSNDVQWRMDTGGGISNSLAVHSTDEGVSWTLDADDDDFLFQILGNPCLNVDNAAVVQGYIKDGDMLFIMQYLNIYAPYYDDYDPSRYFYVRLYNTDGVTLIAQTVCPAWGLKIASIYLNANTAASLQEGGSYYVAVYGDLTTEPISMYKLSGTNWIGTSDDNFRTWVMLSANQIGYYYDVALTTSILGETVLNDYGAVIFISGIPYMTTQHHDWFENVNISVTTPSSTIDTSFNDQADWKDMVGTKISGAFDAVGGAVNIGGSAMFGIAIFIIYMAATLIVGGKGGTVTGLLLSSPILIAGLFLRVIDIQPFAVILSVIVLVAVSSFWFHRS